MSVHLRHPTIVDRINLTLQVDPKTFSLLLDQMFSIEDLVKCNGECGSDLLPGWKINKRPLKYGLRIHLYPKNGSRKIMDMLAFSNKTNSYFFTIGLYPGHFSALEYKLFMEKIKAVLGILMPITYEDMYKTAKVSYLELAADNGSQEMGSFLVSRNHTSISSRFIEKKDGFLGSHYLGSVTSNCRVCIYDKNRQMTKFGYAVSSARRTRIEIRLRRTGLRAGELTEKLGNPFSTLHIADLAKAHSLTSDGAMIQFLKRANLVGTAAALKLQTPKNAYAARALLKKAKAWWWKPDSIGNDLPNAFAQLLP